MNRSGRIALTTTAAFAAVAPLAGATSRPDNARGHAARIEFAVDRTRMHPGGLLKLGGRVAGMPGGTRVILRARSDGRTLTVATTRTNTWTGFAFMLHPRRTATYWIQTSAGRSDAITVRVG